MTSSCELVDLVELNVLYTLFFFFLFFYSKVIEYSLPKLLEKLQIGHKEVRLKHLDFSESM